MHGHLHRAVSDRLANFVASNGWNVDCPAVVAPTSRPSISALYRLSVRLSAIPDPHARPSQLGYQTTAHDWVSGPRDESWKVPNC